VVALAGCLLLPFVEFRANRIVSGEPERVLAAGSRAGCCCADRAGALRAVLPGRLRGPLLLAAGRRARGCRCCGRSGAAAVTLQEGAPDIARVSIGSGAWLAGLGALIIWFAGTRATASPRVRRIVAGVALLGARR
jgi:osmoprotectant transport system permease protein